MTKNRWNLHHELHSTAIIDQGFKGHFQQVHKHWHCHKFGVLQLNEEQKYPINELVITTAFELCAVPNG